MTEYNYSIHIKVENGKAVDYWCEHNDKGVDLPHEAWAAIIGHACQDWRERRQDAADMKLDAMRERG